MNKKIKIIAIIILIIISAITGYKIGSPAKDKHLEHSGKTQPNQEQVWTCSMHPQIKLPRKGLCPICNMELIPLRQDSKSDAHSAVLRLSKNAISLMDVEVATVERRALKMKINMLGKIDFDETRLSYITAWNPGRLEKLFVDYTGLEVSKGEPLVEMYSPELIAAQEEYIQALSLSKQIQSATAKSTAKAAREKLGLLGLTESQIKAIEEAGKVANNLTIYAPSGGIVVERNATQGMYVQTGTKIYTLADLSEVWVFLDAYESDLQWLKIGQKAEFTTVSKPGEIFTSEISFIYPIVDSSTRTVKVRLNAKNKDGILKPGMFVKASVYSALDEAAKLPLTIPASAPLLTGKRAVVYVRSDDEDGIKFEGREVVLGHKAGDYYIVREGLDEGELVVTRGNFKIDSSLQISAKPSMMTETEEREDVIAQDIMISEDFRILLHKLLNNYFEIQKALADDNFSEAIKSAQKAAESINSFDIEPSFQSARNKWRALLPKIKTAANEAKDADTIKALRDSFNSLSQVVEQTVIYFGATGDRSIYIAHCPMVNDNEGANWLSREKEILNPYFGAMMLKCGDIQQEIKPKHIWENHK